MRDPTDEQSEKKEVPDSRGPEEDLKELRKLLLSPIQAQLDGLQKRLDRPDLYARDVSQVLPEAISLRSNQDKKIEMALAPITENAIKSSIRRDRKVLVDALFPVMGPAIRRAIAAAIQGMVQSFNQILEHSLSLNGLKWRIEALKTQRPFAEIVLLHTLVYQVEQVFLIHRDTGLVLQHVVSKTVIADDPDLVSSMLTAIKDFVQDSFGSTTDEALETLRVGERHVWIEHGPQAFLAAVIHGNPPVHLQTVLTDAIEEIHFRQAEAIKNFSGDSEPFEQIRPILENCLEAQFKKERRKPSFLLWAVVILVVIIIGGWSLNVYQENRRWSQYISKLRHQPGIVVTDVETKNGKHHIYGLKDPLAPDPATQLSGSGRQPQDVIYHWEPYYSLLPDFAHRRLHAALIPPETVNLEFKNGVLYARGAALHRWIENSRKQIKGFPWIVRYDESELLDIEARLQPPPTVTLDLKGDTLLASGTANQQWLADAQKKIRAISSISNFEVDQLINPDAERLHRLRQAIERQTLFFKAGSHDLLPGQQDVINQLTRQLEELKDLAESTAVRYHIQITGHSDSSGTTEFNMRISRQRADTIVDMLKLKGLVSDNFITRGVGDKEPLREEHDERDRSANRVVTFKVNTP